jgi:hypothetical protein
MSAAVNWEPVHAWVLPKLAGIPPWPMVGTAEWAELSDDDPRKTAAALDATQHWALAKELDQRARAEASKAIAGAADWPQVAREIQQLDAARRSGVRIERSANV